MRASKKLYQNLQKQYSKRINLDLKRIKKVLSILHDPQDELNNVINVIGSDGKNSFLTSLKYFLEADNKKVNTNTIPDVQKKTGMIFQEFNLVNNLSAINNVLTGLLNTSNKFLSLFYLFKKNQKIEALKSLKTVGLLKKSYNRSDELSGGQRQRVGIARAIIKRPLLLLADEPVASLDPKAANLILSLLKKINKEFGTTILCNLHQVDLAKKYSDRLVGLLDGKIIFDEKSENINKSNLEKIYV